MTIVAVVPETDPEQQVTFRAVAGNKHASGKTIGEAIDALTPQLEANEDNAATLIVVQSQRSDRFFTAEQQQRMAELMTIFRSSRDAGIPMPEAERAELEQCVEAEVNGAGQRAVHMQEALRHLKQHIRQQQSQTEPEIRLHLDAQLTTAEQQRLSQLLEQNRSAELTTEEQAERQHLFDRIEAVATEKAAAIWLLSGNPPEPDAVR